MIKIAVVDDDLNEQQKLSDMFTRLGGEIGIDLSVVTFSDRESFLSGYDKSYAMLCLDIELNTEDDFPTTPVTVPTDDEGNPIVPEISSKDKDGYVFVNGMMIKKSQAISTEYINESD